LESIDLTTDSGRTLYASLLALAPAFSNFIDSVDQATQAMLSNIQQFAATRDSLTGGSANTVAALDARLANQVDTFVAGNPLFQSMYDTQGRYAVANYLTHNLSASDFAGASLEDQQRILGIQQTRIEIANLGTAAETTTPSIYSVVDAIEALADASLAFRAQLGEWLDSLLLNKSLSTLSPERMLAEAKTQYLSALGSGDASKITGAGETYLGLAREFYGSSSGYNAIFDTVRQQVGGLAAGQSVNELLMDSVTVQTQIRDGVNGVAAEVKKLNEREYNVGAWQFGPPLVASN
jgi:hypothetical protein